MRQSYRFKLMASPRLKHLHRAIELAGRIHNHCIAVHRTYYRLYKKHLPKARLQAHLAKLKGSRCPEWKLLNAQAIQAITDRIEAGYQLFFLAKKEGRKGVRPPSFRKLSKFQSFTLKQTGWKLVNLESKPTILIQGRPYRIRLSREIEGLIKTVTVKRDALGDFFVIFSCDQVPSPIRIEAATRQEAGFDFGLKHFLTRDDGKRYAAPLPLKAELRNLQKASRTLSRKVKGSGGRRKARLQLARVHRRVAHIRNDWQWKLSLELIREHELLVFEDLALSGMTQLWGRKMADLGFADFVGKTEWQAEKHHRRVSFSPRFERTTSKCSSCGHFQDLDLSIRVFSCQNCGHTEDRDSNASKNILEGGRPLRCEISVRPTKAVIVISAESYALLS